MYNILGPPGSVRGRGICDFGRVPAVTKPTLHPGVEFVTAGTSRRSQNQYSFCYYNGQCAILGPTGSARGRGICDFGRVPAVTKPTPHPGVEFVTAGTSPRSQNQFTTSAIIMGNLQYSGPPGSVRGRGICDFGRVPAVTKPTPHPGVEFVTAGTSPRSQNHPEQGLTDSQMLFRNITTLTN